MLNEKNIKSENFIGILKENKSIWERRTPLTPEGCKKMIESGIGVIIQPSKQRCFTDFEYSDAGCVIQDNLSSCKVVLSIQDFNQDNLIPETTHMFFSHTIKGQYQNMPLLRKINELKIRLIDYECIREIQNNVEILNHKKGKRLVYFGNLAGIAGTINILKAVGDLLLSKEISTPFIFSKKSYMCPSVLSATENIKVIGEYITKQYLPVDISPFIIGILGNGRVSSGVQLALKLLPHIELSPEDLIKGNYERRMDIIYFVVFRNSDIYSHVKNNNFEFDDFVRNPENYKSIFFEKYFRHLSIIINALYWEKRYPRVLSKNDLKIAAKEALTFRLLGIADISCDLKGAIEVLDEYTTMKKTYFIYDPNTGKKLECFEENVNSIVYHASPDLAASFAIDASNQFNDSLIPYLKDLVLSKYPNDSKDENDYAQVLQMATITANGSLTDHYKNLYKSAEEFEKIQKTRHNYHYLSQKDNFLSLKFQGNLIKTGFLKSLVYNLNKYSIDFDITYLDIGENDDLYSMLYIDLVAENSEILTIFVIETKKQCLEYKCEVNLIDNTEKSNKFHVTSNLKQKVLN